MRQDWADGLLSAADPGPVTWVNTGGAAPMLLLCDHASNRVPAALGSLGLSDEELGRHIGWDIGAADLTRDLSARFDAPALLSGFSRLVIDCNRHLQHPESIPAISDCVVVPGNQGLSAADRAARISALFTPYHDAIGAALDGFARRGVVPAIVSIHSFTPEMNSIARPWQIGVLWDRDPRLPLPLIERLAAVPGLVIGDNEPYTAREPSGFTMPHHAAARGWPHVLLEIRQNEIDHPAGVQRYADYLQAALTPLLADPALYRVEMFL